MPQSKLESQSLIAKQVVLAQAPSVKGMAATMSTPDLRKKQGEDIGTRPGTESTRPGTQGGLSTRPASHDELRPGNQGGLGTRPGTHDGFRPGPTLEERQTGVPEADTQTVQAAWMPTPLGR